MEKNSAAKPGALPSGRTRWRPGVRLVLALVALIPILGIGLLTGLSASSSWSNWQYAKTASADANELKVIAQARLQMNDAAIPVILVASGESLGISEPVVSKLVGIDLMHGSISLPEAAHLMRANPIFISTARLRADVTANEALIRRIEAGTATYANATAVTDAFGTDLDNLWISQYRRLVADVRSWRPPGQLEAHLSALRQTYAAFDGGIYMDRDSIDVMEGLGGSPTKVELFQSEAEFDNAAAQFTGQLGPKAQKTWTQLQSDTHHVKFDTEVRTPALALASNGGNPPYLTNQLAAGVAVRLAIYDVTDMANLVQSAAFDLRDDSNSQASSAQSSFVFDIIFLAALIVVSLGGVVLASRILTRPLKDLESAALSIHEGDFDLDDLPDAGPREVVATTEAFNVMSSTLKAVEAKTVALAEEDLSHIDLAAPLPGRTGQALQAAVERLASRIKEREQQRKALHEAATHDALTTLLNRAAVFEHLTTDVARRRKSGETVAVIFADLDGLKHLNDTYGHEAGDAAIVATGEALIDATDPCDVVGRLGGDEFLSVLCHEHSRHGHEVAERIRQTVAGRTIQAGGTLVALQASVGVALAECNADTDPMELVRIADEKMYEAKRVARMMRDTTSTR